MIQVNEDIRITSDATNNFIVERRRVISDKPNHNGIVSKNAGMVVWDAETYHNDFEQCVRSLVNKGVAESSDMTEIRAFMEEMRQWAKNVKG